MKFSEQDASAIENALQLAITMHRSQRDSDGQPYVLHLIRVMMRCNDPKAKQAGLLHDILEDTSAKPDDLVALGLSPEVIQAVVRLTHLQGISYADYVEAISQDPIATEVKLSDLEDNYALGRVKYRQENHQHDARRLQRYILSSRFLRKQMTAKEYHLAMAQLEHQ